MYNACMSLVKGASEEPWRKRTHLKRCRREGVSECRGCALRTPLLPYPHTPIPSYLLPLAPYPFPPALRAVAQARGPDLAQRVALGEVLNGYDRVSHEEVAELLGCWVAVGNEY